MTVFNEKSMTAKLKLFALAFGLVVGSSTGVLAQQGPDTAFQCQTQSTSSPQTLPLGSAGLRGMVKLFNGAVNHVGKKIKEGMDEFNGRSQPANPPTMPSKNNYQHPGLNQIQWKLLKIAQTKNDSDLFNSSIKGALPLLSSLSQEHYPTVKMQVSFLNQRFNALIAHATQNESGFFELLDKINSNWDAFSELDKALVSITGEDGTGPEAHLRAAVKRKLSSYSTLLDTDHAKLIRTFPKLESNWQVLNSVAMRLDASASDNKNSPSELISGNVRLIEKTVYDILTQKDALLKRLANATIPEIVQSIVDLKYALEYLNPDDLEALAELEKIKKTLLTVETLDEAQFKILLKELSQGLAKTQLKTLLLSLQIWPSFQEGFKNRAGQFVHEYNQKRTLEWISEFVEFKNDIARLVPILRSYLKGGNSDSIIDALHQEIKERGNFLDPVPNNREALDDDNAFSLLPTLEPFLRDFHIERRKISAQVTSRINDQLKASNISPSENSDLTKVQLDEMNLIQRELSFESGSNPLIYVVDQIDSGITSRIGALSPVDFVKRLPEINSFLDYELVDRTQTGLVSNYRSTKLSHFQKKLKRHLEKLITAYNTGVLDPTSENPEEDSFQFYLEFKKAFLSRLGMKYRTALDVLDIFKYRPYALALARQRNDVDFANRIFNLSPDYSSQNNSEPGRDETNLPIQVNQPNKAIDQEELWSACSTGNLSKIQNLVSAKASLKARASNGLNCLQLATQAGKTNVMRYLLTKKRGWIRVKIFRQSPLKLEINKKTDLRGRNLMHLAVLGDKPQILTRSGQEGSVDWLMKNGGVKLLKLQDHHKQNPVQVAASLERWDLVKAFLKADPSINVEKKDSFGMSIIDHLQRALKARVYRDAAWSEELRENGVTSFLALKASKSTFNKALQLLIEKDIELDIVPKLKRV